MNLYLARHAEAIPLGEGRDADRKLSRRGEEDSLLMGRALVRIDSKVKIILTSPLIRARQTGEILGEGMANHPTFQVSGHLSPGFLDHAILEELIALSSGGSIVAIGHQPDLTKFISYLIADSALAMVAMEPGAIAFLRFNTSGSRVQAELRWLLTPDTVKSICTSL